MIVIFLMIIIKIPTHAFPLYMKTVETIITIIPYSLTKMIASKIISSYKMIFYY